MNSPLNSHSDASQDNEERLNQLLSRLQSLTNPGTPVLGGQPKTDQAAPAANTPTCDGDTFRPLAPKSFAEAGLNESLVEELISKFLLSRGEARLSAICHQIKLPFMMVETVVTRMKQEQSLGYIGQNHGSDYLCRLTETGRDKAKRVSDICSYFGAAPVKFDDYIASVRAQTITKQNPSEQDLRAAFSDLLITPEVLEKLGPAVNSGRGMFLFGFPGNGKTSIAERVTNSFGKYIWVPRAIQVDRDIVRLFDPMNHQEVPYSGNDGYLKDDSIDTRWVRIKRPTIVVGGELRLEHLELQYNESSGISEAPVQMKSNCGTLVIDDFGRQQCTVDELLNRWIVPLEKRFDYLNTSSGKKIQVPFDQLVIFSTNLEPKDLVDDAFLRRIPYKIEVPNPPRHDFEKLFQIMAKSLGCEFRPHVITYLIETHYLPRNRPFRNCHPRDLLLQIRAYCHYKKVPFEMTEKHMDFAVSNYFSIM